MEKAIEIKDLTVIYKNQKHKKKALDSLNLEIFQGEIFGFLGPNGAGKTTAIKAILGLLYPTSGEILLFGNPPSHTNSRKKIGYMPEIATYYWYLTPTELLNMYGAFFHLDAPTIKRRTDQLLSLVDLQDSRKILMKNFSKGMMQKVSLAQALVNDPELLILDEPTSGLDPLARMKMRDIIRDLKTKGRTIFFSSHELSEVELISDRIAILNHGLLFRSGKLNELLEERGQHQSLEQYFLKIVEG